MSEPCLLAARDGSVPHFHGNPVDLTGEDEFDQICREWFMGQIRTDDGNEIQPFLCLDDEAGDLFLSVEEFVGTIPGGGPRWTLDGLVANAIESCRAGGVGRICDEAGEREYLELLARMLERNLVALRAALTE